jgi:hypothetical protein
MMHERRSTPRRPLKAKVVAMTDTAPDVAAAPTAQAAGWLLDASPGGMRVSMRKSLPIQDVADFRVECSAPWEVLPIRGRVGWIQRESEKSFTCGIFICETSKERLLNWRRMLTRRGLSP